MNQAMKKILFFLLVASIAFVGCSRSQPIGYVQGVVISQSNGLDGFSLNVDTTKDGISDVRSDVVLSNFYNIGTKVELTIIKIGEDTIYDASYMR